MRLRGKGGKKEKPTQKQPALQAPPAQRPGLWCGAGRLGWKGECGESSQACAPRPALQEMPPAHPHPAPRSSRDAGRKPGAPRTAALPGLYRSRSDPARPGAPALFLPQRRVCSRGRGSGKSRARPHLCAFSRAARRERRRPRSASPRRPLQRWRPAPQSGMLGGGRFALLLVHKAAAMAGDWAAGRCARPDSAGTDTRCSPHPTPLGAHFPASAPALGTEQRGRVLLGPRLRLFPGPPALMPFLRHLVFRNGSPQCLRRRPGSVVAKRACISLVLG